jgi:hypothetical protein
MRPSVEEALLILREAVSALASPEAGDRLPDPAIVADLRHHAEATTRVLEAAWEIQNAVLRRVSRAVVERLSSSPLVARHEPPWERSDSPAPPPDPTD